MFSPVSVGIFPEKVYLSVQRHFQRISYFGMGELPGKVLLLVLSYL